MKDFYIIATTKANGKPYYQLNYRENGEIYVGYSSYDFEKVLKWKEENLDVKEIVVNENGETTYEQGLTDAWEVARKIVTFTKDGGLSVEALEKIFGTQICEEIIRDFDVFEAITKIKAYEKEQKEIKVGDEVFMNFAPNEVEELLKAMKERIE